MHFVFNIILYILKRFITFAPNLYYLYINYADLFKFILGVLGILVKTKEKADSADFTSYKPFTLFPSPFSRAHFFQACSVHQSFNLLMHKVAHDYEFLKEALKRYFTGSCDLR